MVWSATFHAEAQQTPEPAPPYVRNAPGMASWKITVSRCKSASPEAESGEIAAREIDVIKTATIRHELVFSGSGQTSERWFCSGIVLLTGSGSSILVADSRDENVKQMVPNYAASDFPELLWIVRSCYAGVQKFGAAVCYYYAEPSGVRQAWIDRTTGMPVAYCAGGILQNYLFQEPPARLLELPIPVQKALKDFNAARDLSHHEAKYN